MESNEDLLMQPSVVSAADLRNGEFERPLDGLAKTDAYDLSKGYRQALSSAPEGSDHERAWALMQAICGMSLQPDDRADPWRPQWSTGLKRSSLPSDFLGDQNSALGEILELVKHPSLRARLADVVWTNDRRQGKAARIAVDAYCECAEGLLSGALSSFGEDRGSDLLASVDLTHRALQIAFASSKRGQMPERPKALIRAVFEASKAAHGYVALVRAGEIAIHFEALEPVRAALAAEALAGSAPGGEYAMAVHGIWKFAARIYEGVKDNDGRQRALKGALNQTLAMREQNNFSAGAAAHWVMAALQELRHIEGMEDLEVSLETELRRLQKASVKELGRFTFKIDVKDEVEAVSAFYETCSLSDGLREFALLDQSRDPDELRTEALQGLDRTPLSSMFSAIHMDDEGRNSALSSAASLGGEPDESWFTHTIERSEHLRRVHTVAGRLHPARILLNGRFGIGERHLVEIVRHSPFVPASQGPLFALGLTRFFQGDFMSATHLLQPQLEPCLRYILKQAGHDPSKRRDDTTEEDLSLSGMFERMRPELEDLLGGDLAAEVDRLFNLRPGPALRHELAHGQLSAGACFAEDVYYANWLLYRIAVLPLVGHWDRFVEPALKDH